MPPRLVTIATFPNALEAGVARDRLLTEGIAACLANEGVVGMMWHLSNAVGGVKVQVYEDDTERARTILTSDQDGASGGGAWQCPKCGQAIVREFNVCWSCGTSRDGVEDPDFAASETEAAEDDVTRVEEAERDPPVIPAAIRGRTDDDNPFRSPLAEDEPASEFDEALTRTADEIALRAWRAAIVGLFCCPPLLHFYSIYLLLKIGNAGEALSPAGSRRYYAALVIDALLVLGVGYFVKDMFFGLGGADLLPSLFSGFP